MLQQAGRPVRLRFAPTMPPPRGPPGCGPMAQPHQAPPPPHIRRPPRPGRRCPGPSEPALQRPPQVGQAQRLVGVVGGGGVHRGLAGLDRRIQVGQRPSPLKASLQRVSPGWSGTPPGQGGRQGRRPRRPGQPRSPPPGRPARPCVRTGFSAQSPSWTGHLRGRAGRRGGVTAARPASIAASRSASAPVRPNRACSAAARLDRYITRSGWPEGWRPQRPGKPRSPHPGRPARPSARTGAACRSPGWTRTMPGRGGREG